MLSITASKLRREGWDDALAYVRGTRQSVAVTRYGVVIAHLSPVPQILVSDPTLAVDEQIRKHKENYKKTPQELQEPQSSPLRDTER